MPKYALYKEQNCKYARAYQQINRYRKILGDAKCDEYKDKFGTINAVKYLKMEFHKFEIEFHRQELSLLESDTSSNDSNDSE